MNSLLRIENLHASVGAVPILMGVSLAVAPGTIHYIMGPNGSGKTTLAHAIMGHPGVTITQGSMAFMGEDMMHLAPEERAKKGLYLAFQSPVEVPGVGMMSYMRTVLAARGESVGHDEDARASLAPIISQMHMASSLLDRNLNEGFSGGEKKRSEILQLHMLNPTLAILDEFDSGMDVDGVRAAAESLNAWMGASPERALVVITHTGRVSEFLKPDAVHIMMAGRIVRSGGSEIVAAVEAGGFEQFELHVSP